MWNIIRAQWYQLIRDKRVRGTFVVMLLFNAAFTFANIDGYEEIKGGRIMADMGSFFGLMGLLFMLVLMAFVMGTDFVDKTLYYEILTGHSRKEVLFGRFLVALSAGSLGAMTIMLFCPLVLTVGFGWGYVPEAGSTFLRCVLVFGVLFRIACETMLIAVIVKNPYATIFAGYIIGCVELLLLLLKELMPGGDIFLQFFSVCQCTELLNFSGLQGMEEAAGEAVSGGFSHCRLVFIAVMGLAASTAAVMAAYAYFKRDDLQ